MKKRAEHQAETRRRIVAAAVELHGRLGPARTPLSLIAERAGVQRKTFYAHFPDERSLHLACSAHALERDPPPDAQILRNIPGGERRIRAGLAAQYDWYARNSELIASVLRDSEYHELTREVFDLRFGPPLRAMSEVLSEGLGDPQRVLLAVALSFQTWRTLTEKTDPSEAVELMTQAVARAGRSSSLPLPT